MGKSEISEDRVRYKIVSEELKRLYDLIKGHEKLLRAIGNL